MAYKSIVTVMTDAQTDGSALEAAVKLAHQNDAHLDVICLGLDRTQPGFYYAGTNAMILQDNLKQANEDAVALAEKISARLEGESITWATLPVAAQLIGLTQVLSHHTRFSDIAVLALPYGEGRAHEDEQILEAAMFNGHVPVMVVPAGATLPDSFDRVVVGWNESHEAMQAIRAALPILTEADITDVVIVDPPQHGPDRSDPGGALSQLLVRHGVRIEVSVLAKTMPRVADILSRHARDKKADLLVMGAYGHSRFRESILGGATRNMLESAEIPVLMAH